MSELINNGKEKREKLKKLILDLHDGRDFEEVRDEFQRDFGKVSAREISDMERELISEGMEVEAIHKLCDVHAAVFKGSIEEIHADAEDEMTPGHPVHTFKRENEEIGKRVGHLIEAIENGRYEGLLEGFSDLLEIEKHYLRKENIIFPVLEKHGVYGPPQVMWSVDDEVRAELKQILNSLKENPDKPDEEKLLTTLNKINEMIYKEDNILIPMAVEMFTLAQWKEVKDSESEIGYSYVKPGKLWKPETGGETGQNEEKAAAPGHIKLASGVFDIEELQTVLNTLPLDITFVDKNDKVKYFSEGKERIFPRTRAIIGREVKNCHPPASVHIVEKLVEEFKTGKKDQEDFWIKSGGKFIFIRYFAVRDDEGGYLGVLEVTQEVSGIRNLEGEKRLAD